jgi:hypothetical protein
MDNNNNNNNINNYVTLVRERTIQTERPPLVGEVTANFCGWWVPHGQRDGSLRPYSGISRPESLLFLPSSFSIVLTRLRGPRFRPTTSQKMWLSREWNPGLWICSQELWPLDHRGGLRHWTIRSQFTTELFHFMRQNVETLILNR